MLEWLIVLWGQSSEGTCLRGEEGHSGNSGVEFHVKGLKGVMVVLGYDRYAMQKQLQNLKGFICSSYSVSSVGRTRYKFVKPGAN